MNFAFKTPELSDYDKRTVDEFKGRVCGLSELALKIMIDACCKELGSVYARYTLDYMLNEATSILKTESDG